MIKLFNSLSKEIEEFRPIKEGEVKIYTCGPTVYNIITIGNLRSNIFSDILAKTFRYFDYKVYNVVNLTDIDDKTIKGSKKSEIQGTPNEKLITYTSKYAQYFYEDIEKLNIDPPYKFEKATENIKEMEYIINKLYEKDIAYISDDGIYFNIFKDKNHGRLTNIKLSDQEYNKSNRVIDDEYDKENAADFVLWKFKKEEDEPSWTIKIGEKEIEGRPGWHIECSAMNYKVHGPSLDIHTGGEDLKFPHHENEIAQSECAFSSNYVNYWLHNEFVLVEGEKMSKSKGNIYTLRDIEDKGYHPLAWRELTLRSHYRSQLNFTLESLKAANNSVNKINEFKVYLENLTPSSREDKKEIEEMVSSYRNKFEEAMKNDLDTPVALSSLYEFIREVYKLEDLTYNEINNIIRLLTDMDSILGLLKYEEEIPKEIIELAEKRKEARDNKDFKLADNLRDEIKSRGWNIKDVKESKKKYILEKL